jgi:hypothetical protein
VRHSRGGRHAVPMLLIRREPDQVTGPNLLNRASPALRQAAASRYDQGLAQRMGVPCSPRARFKRDNLRRARVPGRVAGTEGQRVQCQ